MDSNQSESRRIVVTGVSRGLGRAMTAGFVAAGHQVIGCARDAEAVKELNADYGDAHRFDVVDVGEMDQVSNWARAVLADGRPPDLLVNSAALMNEGAPLWEVSAEEFDQLMKVNISGVANVIRAFVPAMVAESRGIIVNFSSTWGRSVSANVAPYCASKWAIEGLTRALAEELPSGMAAIPLNPGIINTDMLQTCFGSRAEGFPSPTQWTENAVPYILGFEAKHNGQPLAVPH